jgi:hypothetical protein
MLSPEIVALIDRYERGPTALRQALAGFPADQLKTPLPPGKWSAHQVVCHVADFEIVGADRIKSVIAEDGPQLPGRDEERFAARLHYGERVLANELSLIELVRRQIGRLVRSLEPADFRRVGIHSVAGPLSLAEVLNRLTEHIPHHADFIERKKRSLS